MSNYSYLADGTKLEAVDGSGEGLVYRGPFVYRKSPGSSSLTLESVSFGGGRLAAGKALPFIPGGVGAARAGAKVVNAADDVADAAKGVKVAKGKEIAKGSSSAVRNSESSIVKTKLFKGGETADTKLGRQMHKVYNPGDEYIKEFRLPSGKRVDAVSIEKGDIRELKPNNSKAIKRGEKQAQTYMNELQTLYPDINWEYNIDVYNK